MNAESMNLT